jgi:hypothetical protein
MIMDLYQFTHLSTEDKEYLLEFLANLTEGDLIKLCREMSMDHEDTRRLLFAHERFTADDEIPT